MVILALDLASTTGYAIGPAGGLPTSSAERLKKPSEPHARAIANLIRLLEKMFRQRPDAVVKEEMMDIGAMLKRNNSRSNIELQCGLHLATEAMCILHEIPCHSEGTQTIRKHFLGRARFSDGLTDKGKVLSSREVAKNAVVQRCQLLGYMQRSETDDNQGDACATWDWGCATLARRSPKLLTLFQN